MPCAFRIFAEKIAFFQSIDDLMFRARNRVAGLRTGAGISGFPEREPFPVKGLGAACFARETACGRRVHPVLTATADPVSRCQPPVPERSPAWPAASA